MNREKTITLGEVVLNVTNIEEEVTFYQQIIGLTILHREKSKVILGVKETKEALIVLIKRDKEESIKAKVGLYHMAFLLPSRESFSSVLRYLLSRDVPLIGGADHGYSEAIYLDDPEGNGIEIYWDKPETEWNKLPNGQIKGITRELDIEGILSLTTNFSSELPIGTTMGHVHLTVSNLEETERFYQDILGFKLTDNLGGHANFFAKDGYHHHIGTNNWGNVSKEGADNGNLGLSYFTINWLDEKNYLNMKERVKNNHLTMIKDTETSFYIMDTDGIMIKMERK